eukprot:297301-Rhodomonas_salina.1
MLRSAVSVPDITYWPSLHRYAVSVPRITYADTLCQYPHLLWSVPDMYRTWRTGIAFILRCVYAASVPDVACRTWLTA